MGEQVTYSKSEAVEENSSGNTLYYLDKKSFSNALEKINSDPVACTALFAQMARFNTLYMVSRAGSGHLGSSFSSLDIVSWLYLNVLTGNDRYYSSKGHDSPGLYSVLAGLDVIPFEKIHALRRIKGLPGHPTVETAGMHANTGSLGMGISKAKGFIKADRLLGRKPGRVFVMTGDGELQEGQIWESLMSAARDAGGQLIAIVDHNKIQSDTYVDKVSSLGDLEAKFRAFGWEARTCDGHNLDAIKEAVSTPTENNKPLAVIANTIKGKGVSFMEHTSMAQDAEYYVYHSGAPSREDYLSAQRELLNDIQARSQSLGLELPPLLTANFEPVALPEKPERMIPAYTDAILHQAGSNPNLVALDADLILDTGLIPFKERFPERFFECGIAEQDMVSQAGAMALGGLLPVVHSFSCFLTARPVEQIYNNCTERTKVVYVGTLAGVLPAGPGSSHQAIRDISTMSSLPDFLIIEPICASQVAEILDWACNTHSGSSYIRLTSIPYSNKVDAKTLNPVSAGVGHVLCDGHAATFIVSSPVLVAEALSAAEMLAVSGVDIRVIATPWLNRIDTAWYAANLNKGKPVITIENHFVDNGFGNFAIAALAEQGILESCPVDRVGIRGHVNCGRNAEVLASHNMDAASIAERMRSLLRT